MTFAERLRAWRTVRGWTLSELARRADIQISGLSRIERGRQSCKAGGPDDQFSRILDALDMTPIEFFSPLPQTIPAPWSDAAHQAA